MQNNRKKCIAISILNVSKINIFLDDICKIKNRIQKELKTSFDIVIHFDVMDEKFVKNSGVKLSYIKNVKERGLFADVHLMVENPIKDKYIDEAIEYGADNIIIHYEIKNFKNTLEYLNEKKQEDKLIAIGVAIKPNTNIDVLQSYKDKFDNILVMSVEPGFGGQKYMISVNDKLKGITKMYKNKYIEVDGGVNIDTITEPYKYNVNGFVIGSYITNNPKIDVMYDKIKKILEIENNN